MLILIYQQSTQTLAKTYKQNWEETKVIEATEPLTNFTDGVDTGNVGAYRPMGVVNSDLDDLGNSKLVLKPRKL